MYTVCLLSVWTLCRLLRPSVIVVLVAIWADQNNDLVLHLACLFVELALESLFLEFLPALATIFRASEENE